MSGWDDATVQTAVTVLRSAPCWLVSLAREIHKYAAHKVNFLFKYFIATPNTHGLFKCVVLHLPAGAIRYHSELSTICSKKIA